MSVTIVLDEEQARTVVAALDLLMRAHLGQWHVLTERLKWQNYRDMHGTADLLRAAAWIYTRMDAGASYGITNMEVDEEARIAADIKDTIRHELWRASSEARRQGYGVDAFPPLKHSELPLPKVTVTKEKKA